MQSEYPELTKRFFADRGVDAEVHRRLLRADLVRVILWSVRGGIAVALALSLPVGAVMAASRFVEEAAQPVLVLILVTPWVAYITSVVLWLDGGVLLPDGLEAGLSLLGV